MPSSGDFAKLEQLARNFEKLGADGRKVVAKACAAEAATLTSETFQAHKAPDGTAWAPLKLRGGEPLRDTGRLFASLTPTLTADGFKVGTNVVYAAIQQHGGTVRAKQAKQLFSKKLGKGFGKAVTIPARPFLPESNKLPASWEKRLEEAAEDAVELLLKKGQ
jgi:phage gpG-like protein